MREMIYSAKQKREILSTGYCFGLLYFGMWALNIPDISGIM